MKKIFKQDNNYPFSIQPCSMSYTVDDDGDYEIIYNGVDFEIVPKFKNNTHSLDGAKYSISDSEWESEWLNEWREVEKDLTHKNKCNHEWKATQLLFSTVYDCHKCGVKKEENK